MRRSAKLRTAFTMDRATPFSYACHACSRCCHGKIIPLNPYEVARLAAHRGISTTEFLAEYTDNGGATLRTRDDGACVFLGPQGCEVHAARPLACRLYPLGRYVGPDGAERFAEMEPHPETEGVYAQDGTVDGCLHAQDVTRHAAASDRYVALLKRMLPVLARSASLGEVQDDATAAMARAPVAADESLLDVDRVVARYCEERGRPVPADVEERVALHIAALEEALARWA